MSTDAILSLPAEILEDIFAYVAATDRHSQSTLHACTLVSRSWYSSSIAFLYANPDIKGRNYDAFVRAICPSINSHVRTNGLANLIKRLDMSSLVHNGSKSLTARILGRVKESMEEFVAPQASFAVNCLAALSKCSKLRHLNLSFVSESIAMSDLLRSISYLWQLKALHLPRSSSSVMIREDRRHDWPCGLQSLYISGGLHDSSLFYLSTLPFSVTSLSLGNCTQLSEISMSTLLGRVGPHLQYLEILAPMPALFLDFDILQEYLRLLPNLTHLKVSVDFMVTGTFALKFDNPSVKRLDLHCFDPADCTYTKPSYIYTIVGMEAFTKVRVVGFHDKLGWEKSAEDRRHLSDLSDLLKALAREDGDDAEISEDEAGLVRMKFR